MSPVTTSFDIVNKKSDRGLERFTMQNNLFLYGESRRYFQKVDTLGNNMTQLGIRIDKIVSKAQKLECEMARLTFAALPTVD